MLHTTAGKLAVNSVLPEDLRSEERVLDKDGLKKLFQEIADKHPEKYREISHDLHRIGHHTAYYSGGDSFGLRHLRTSLAGMQSQLRLKSHIQNIYANQRLTDNQKEEAVVQELMQESEPLEKAVYAESLNEKNPLANQVKSGARGNPMNLRSLRAGDLLYVDHHDHPIPIPILRSYSQGLSPVEYFAGSFGARKGVTDTKFATQDAGFFCLAKGTLVRMADGSSKAIELIKPGDLVLGADKNGTTFSTRVSAVFANGFRDVWRFRFSPVGAPRQLLSLDATLAHQVLGRSVSSDSYAKIPLANMVKGSQLLNAFTTVLTSRIAFAQQRAKVRAILRKNAHAPFSVPASRFDAPLSVSKDCTFAGKQSLGPLQTYDIEVEHPDHLFVLDNGVIVSNSKQLNQVAHRLVVSARDSEKPHEHISGLPVDLDDPDNEGALLGHDAGGYKRNTVLTPKILADLRSQGIKRMLVRSPMVGGPDDGGVYGADLGVREKGIVPPVGDYVGIAAAQALSEPLSQAQLSSKHSGGVAGSAKGVSGFKLVNQLVQVPKHFKGGAAHAQIDGKVQDVKEAPQGGTYVTIGGQQHYLGTGYASRVKPGDIVEAGDVLSEGIPNPSEIVKHKGIGEGRRYFTKVFRDAYKDSGIGIHRRNIELLSRGLIDHVRLTEEMDDYVPGDIVPYSRLEHYYRPRHGYDVLEPKRAEGMYLERPVLHYSIGTKVRPSVIKDMGEFGVKNVTVHRDPPPFETEMVRGMENLAHDPDWMTRFLGSYLEKNLLKGVHTSGTSDAGGTSYVPALAQAEDFGRAGKTVGYDPKDLKLGS